MQIKALLPTGAAACLRCAPHAPLRASRCTPVARRALVVRAVAKPRGTGASSGPAGSGESWIAGRAAELKQLVTPFADPVANSKMLSLAAGELRRARWPPL
jgi:hypothetical protein